MKKFFKTILLGMVSLFSITACNNTTSTQGYHWTQGNSQNNKITISTIDVTIEKANRKSVTGNGVKYYFHVEATCFYKNAEIYGYFVLMDSNNKILEELNEVKAKYTESTSIYTFDAEIKENTFNKFERYTASFKGTAYSESSTNTENIVGDETITATNLYISGKKARLGIKSLYNLTYLSYDVSLYFNTYTGPMKIEGEISTNIEANKEYIIDLDTNINFSYEKSAYTFEVKKAKTTDKVIKDKKIENKQYTYVFLDIEDCLYDYRIFNQGISGAYVDGEFDQTITSYPYLTFEGYRSEEGKVDFSFGLPTPTKNRVFYPEVGINNTNFTQEAKKKNNTQKSSIKVVNEYYDTVLGVIKYTAGESHGSGIIIAGDKSSNNEYYYALTNYHVIEAIVEKDYSGHEGIRGKAIDYDEKEYTFAVYATDKQHDLALIRFQANKTFHPANISFESSDVFKYEYVVAIGCPGSSFLKVTTGSYTGTLNIRNDDGSTQTCITHTAEIDHGSSGGPLFNWRLQLVGLNKGISSNNKYCAVSLSDIRNFVYQYNLPF